MAKSGKYSRSLLGASDEIKDIYCEPCGNDGLVALAEGYCKDCHEYLCAQCYRTHRRNKMLASHVLLDKNSMPITLGSKKAALDICEQKCTIHFDKVIELFCVTCDKLGCTICITIDHRQCDKVKHIPDIAKDLINSQELTAFHESIQSTADKLSDFEQKLQANATSNNEMQKLAKKELKRQRAEINTFFDELEKKMDDQILTIEKRNKDTLKAASSKLMPLKKDLNEITNDIEAKKAGQNCELFISMKNSKEKMRTLDYQFNKLQGDLTIQHYTLLPSEQIQAMMSTTTEICRISTTRTTKEISRTLTTRTTTENSKTLTARTTPESCRTPTASLESVIDIKTSRDKTKPSIRSLIVMHGHYCVVVDSENRSMKVVDTKSQQVTSEIGIEAEFIWGMTSVSDDHVVISVLLSGSKYQFQFFSVSISGVIQSRNERYNVEDYYMDMVHCKGNIYGVCSTHDRIDILSMTGKITRKINRDDKGAELFGYLNRISLSTDGRLLYVTDNDSVTSLTLDGKVNAVYIDKDLKSPWGTTVDKHGYVYVCSRGTHNVQQLTADLNKVQILVKDVSGINITYSSTENKLYTDDNDNVNVYLMN